MDTIERAALLGQLQHELYEDGYTVEEMNDLPGVNALVTALGKPYLTPFSSPLHNDFTAQSVIWLLGKKHGEPVFLGCARLEDLGTESVASYWPRIMSRHYGPDRDGPVIRDVRPEVSTRVGGKMVYFGDLYVSPKARGSRSTLRSLIQIGHLAVSLKWNPDWTYCFIREADVLRGAAALYGFPVLMPAPFEWIDPPYPRNSSEWLAALPRSSLLPQARATLQSTRKLVK